MCIYIMTHFVIDRLIRLSKQHLKGMNLEVKAKGNCYHLKRKKK